MNQNGEYTKHYYADAARIASKIGSGFADSISGGAINNTYALEIMQNELGLLTGDTIENIACSFVQITHLQGDSCKYENALYFYHGNHLSSTQMITDINGDVAQAVLYTPWGSVISEYKADWMLDTIPRYLFNSKEKDEESGLYYYEARYYNPNLTTFTARDPLFEKYFWISPYCAFANNPVIYIDPDGETPRIYTEKTGLFGHAFITVGEGKNTIVYTYGRYLGGNKEKSKSNSIDRYGRGVLIKLTGKEAQRYIKHQLKDNKANVYKINDASDDKVQEHFDKIFSGGRKLTSEEAKEYNKKTNKFGTSDDARVIDTYDLLNNSCVTKTIEGAKASGTQENFLEQISSPYNSYTPSEAQVQPMSPSGLNGYLNTRAKIKNSNVENVTNEMNKQ